MTLLAQSRQPRIRADALAHIPGDRGLPFVGDTLKFLADPLRYCEQAYARYGAVSSSTSLFERRVNLLSADANEFVLLDRAQNFSAAGGWEPILGQLFQRGLMLRDGDDHRYHRRLMQPAFRKEALGAYLERMQPRIAATLGDWRQRANFLFYPSIKRLTLEIAADIFLGAELQAEVDQINTDFSDLVEASNAVIRVPLIGRRFARGLAGRRRLSEFIGARIATRRAGSGHDLLSQLCRARDEQGQSYSDAEIVDHLIFVMMAAHDTTTSALSTIVYALAKHPVWQERLRIQVMNLSKPALDFDDLEPLQEIDWVLRESLRLYPPLTTIVRRAVRDCEIHGVRIPGNTSVSVYPVFTQRQAQWWTDPATFDPERFSPARAEHKRHAFAWIPFGGGAHMCLGLHFAEMQVKAVLASLLRQSRIEVAPGYVMPYRLAPLTHPRDGLPVRLSAL